MSSSLGALEFQMMADLSQLKRDMDDAKRSVSGAMDGIESAVGMAKSAFVGLIGIGSVSSFAGMIQGSISAAASLSDLSKSTGLSVDALSRFSDVGRTTNTSADAIASMMNKLSKETIAAKDGTTGAGVAITALGLNFTEFQRLSPDDKLKTLATSMNEVGIGSDKSAAAMQLLGKSGAEAIPFLTDLANAGDTVARVTNAQAEAADTYEDNLTLLKAAGTEWQNQLALGMLPALADASTAFLDVTKEAGGFGDKVKTLAADGTLANWTRNSITALTYVGDAFEGVATVVKSTGLVIGAWIASLGNGFTTVLETMKRATDGDFKGAMETMESGFRQQKTIVSELGTELDKTWSEQTLGSKLRARMEDLKETGAASESIKPKLDLTGQMRANEEATKASTAAQKEAEKQAKQLAAEIKKMDEAYGKLNSSIDEKTSAMLREMEQGSALTESQKIENKLLADLASSTIILTDEQLENTLANINNMAAVEAKVAVYKNDEAQIKANTAANVDMLAKLEKGTEDINAQAEKVREHTSTIGLNKDELALLSIQKDLDRATTLDQKAAWAEQNGLGSNLVDMYRSQASGLRDLAALKEQGIHVQAAREADVAWQKTTMSIATGLGSALATAIGQGKDLWLTFRDYMVKVILDGAIKNALSSVLGDGINWLMNSIAGIKIPGLGSVSSLIPGVTSLLPGATTVIPAATAVIPGATAAVTHPVATSVLGATTGTELGVLGTGAETVVTTTPASTTLASLAQFAGPAFFAAIGLKLLSGGGPETKYGASYAATGDGAVSKIYGNNTGGEFPNGVMPSSIADTIGFINAQLAAGGSSLRVASFSAGGESDIVKPEGYSYAGGTLTDGSTFGIPSQNGDNLGIADNEAVLAAFQADLAAAAAQAIELGLTGGITTPLATHTFVPYQHVDQGFEGFANGGDHRGGWRIVGERGPELEATGPSRIFNAEQTASMLRSGGASNDEVVAELRAMREQLAALYLEARRTANATNGNGESPQQVEVVE